MIDLHCHYLPFVDDGANSVAEAMELAASAVANGITHAVLTPHVYAGRWENTAVSLAAPFEAFRTMLNSSALPLQLSLGAEVHLLPETLEWARAGLLPALGQWEGANVLLLELPDSHIPAGTLNAVAFLRSLNFVPMLAHPERNKDVMADPRRLKSLVDAGCLVQITAASVIGAFGARAQQCAWQLLEVGCVTAIASDAHNLKHRPPRMWEAREAVAQRLGKDLADRLTNSNPARIVGLSQASVDAAS
jgi:protein-tyrosine phosphatase